MDSRERLARAISDARLWAGAWDKMSEPERNQFRQMAEGVLASDWLKSRDQRVREEAAHRACVAYQHGEANGREWDYFVAAADAIAAAIRGDAK